MLSTANVGNATQGQGLRSTKFDPSAGLLLSRGGEGGRGFWTQNLVYQKWPDQIFPIVNFVFSHYGHFGLGRGGRGFWGSPPPPWFVIILKKPCPSVVHFQAFCDWRGGGGGAANNCATRRWTASQGGRGWPALLGILKRCRSPCASGTPRYKFTVLAQHMHTSVYNVVAHPARPRRAVRPTRCMCSTAVVGNWYDTTWVTLGMSTPRAAMGEQTRIGKLPAVKALRRS